MDFLPHFDRSDSDWVSTQQAAAFTVVFSLLVQGLTIGKLVRRLVPA